MYAGSYRYLLLVQNKTVINYVHVSSASRLLPKNYRYPLAQRTDIYQCLLIGNLIAKITVKYISI